MCIARRVYREEFGAWMNELSEILLAIVRSF